MLISLHDLQLHERQLEFSEKWGPGSIDLGPDLRQVGLLESTGRASLVEEHHGRKGLLDDIRLEGQLTTNIEVLCARCLEPVRRNVQRSFDLLYRPQGSDAGTEEITVSKDEVDIGYYQGDGLLLEDVLREQMLLAVPIKIVCSEDCKGLCPQCGQNLNQGQCACPEPVVNNPLGALTDLRDKLSH